MPKQSQTSTHPEALTIADMTALSPLRDPFQIYGTQVQSFFRQPYGNLVEKADQTENPDTGSRLPRRLQETEFREAPLIAMHQSIKVKAVFGKVNNFKVYPDTILRHHKIDLSPETLGSASA